MSSLDPENPHHHLIQRQLPAWSHQASPEQWQALNQTFLPAQGLTDTHPAWFANAAPDLREAVLTSQARLAHSQQALARSLKGLKNVAEFAEPLLAQQLTSEHQLSAPLRNTELIHIHHLFTFETYVSQHERRSLLEAALHNFEDAVEFSRESALALSGDAQIEKTAVVGKTSLGDSETRVDIELESETYEITPLRLTPADFARTCRALDLGQRYQEHLDSQFAPAQVATLATQVHKDRLRLAADLAFLRQRINGAALDRLQALLDQSAPLVCRQLSLFGIDLYEVLILDLDATGLLLYLPGHATALQQFHDLSALHDQLRDDLLQVDFRQRFLAYVSRDQQETFLSRLRQNLDADGDSPNNQTWPLRDSADLHLALVAIEDELFSFLYQDHVTRLKTEARQLAVPTAEVDEQARKRRLAAWESIGLNTLMMAGFFVPGVGTLMTAVVAYQLLDEVYEGYQAWSVGDRHLALHHLEVVGLNLALIGGLHIAGQVVPKLFNSRLMESLDPVTLEDASQRLWRPDLTPYRSTVQLPETLEPNAMGQYLYQDKHYINMDGQWYAQRLDAELQRWRIVHPADAEAYQPQLEHNGDGAWRAEHEQPQGWSLATLVRRLDTRFDGFDDQQLEQAARISGVSANELRYTHLANARTPALLADTLKRMSVEGQLAARLAVMPTLDASSLFEQLYNGSESASPLQARLMTRYPRLTLPLARQLLTRLYPGEVPVLEDQTPLPAWLEHSAAQVSSDLPMARALEGLYVTRLTATDSERLALLALESLYGWPTNLRLELRAGGAEGALLAKAGTDEALRRRIVIKGVQGYEAFTADSPRAGPLSKDLCATIVQALPTALREEMGLQQLPGETLRERLLERINDDQMHWARRLWRPAEGWRKVGALRGGSPLDPTLANTPATLRNTLAARYRRLFPSTSDQEIEQTLHQWQRESRVAAVELQRLEEHLHVLRGDLRRWANGLPRRQRAIQPIVNAWRRVSSLVMGNGRSMSILDLRALDLENQDMIALALPDSFRHVQSIDLSGNRLLSELPAEFLERFPLLRTLYLPRCRFSAIPRIANPLALNWLDMQANRITWDAQAQAAMDRLYGLDMLDLSDNPLLTAPSFHAMHGLRTLRLGNCSLTRLPEGLQALEHPELINLEDNQFTTLAEGFQLPHAHASAMRLESDSLSGELHAQIRAYYQQHGADLLLADSDYDELLEGISADQRLLWERLPLNFRRDLRELLLEDDYIADPQSTQEAVWARLQRMDQDPAYMQLALDFGAEQLLQLPL